MDSLIDDQVIHMDLKKEAPQQTTSVKIGQFSETKTNTRIIDQSKVPSEIIEMLLALDFCDYHFEGGGMCGY